MADNTGKVVQVIGPVLDVEFEAAHLPEIYNALSLKTTNEAGQEIELIAEVQQHIGRGQVRAVSMSSTDGVTRGMEVSDTGASISVPVGEAALGRILNVLGEPVDEKGMDDDDEKWSRDGSKDEEASPELEVLVEAEARSFKTSKFPSSTIISKHLLNK